MDLLLSAGKNMWGLAPASYSNLSESQSGKLDKEALPVFDQPVIFNEVTHKHKVEHTKGRIVHFRGEINVFI